MWFILKELILRRLKIKFKIILILKIEKLENILQIISSTKSFEKVD